MTKEELKKYLQTDNKSGYKTRESHIIKNFPELYKDIINNSIDNIPYKEQLFLYVNNLYEKPKCPMCGNEVKYLGKLNKGYNKYCSKICSNNDPNVVNKIRETNIITQNKFEIKSKIKNAIKRKYGVDHHLQLDKYLEKRKETNIKKYGVDHHLKLTSQQKKQKQTNIEKYGVEYVGQSKEFKEKAKQTNIKKYGVDNVFKSEEFKEKIKLNQLIDFKKRWSKILKIKTNDIIIDEIKNRDIIIKNHCANHPHGFEITKGQLFERELYLKHKNICTICNPISEQSSIKENEIKNWLKNDLNLNIIENDRTILDGKEIDIYLPEHKLGIEFNGLYWHSNVKIDKNYHLNKTELAESKGIQLIHIFEDEWIYKSKIVKSIIKSKLGLNEDRIYARKTIIKEVDVKQSKEFLNNNHLQGFVGSKLKLGLYYNNELVSLMTFEKLRKGLGNHDNSVDKYNLNRFCNKLNTSVIGGASKLFKYFLREYKPKETISYADRRYSQGGLYFSLNFNKIHNSKPDYFYFNPKELKRYHRFNFRKENLINEGYDINNTENTIMISKNYYKIYDSGKIRFKFNMSLLDTVVVENLFLY